MREVLRVVRVGCRGDVGEKNYELEFAGRSQQFREGAGGIRLLMGREQLRSEIQLGIEQLDRGESSDEDSVFAEIDAAIDEVEASQRGE